jgi:hypothetical protein
VNEVRDRLASGKVRYRAVLEGSDHHEPPPVCESVEW